MTRHCGLDSRIDGIGVGDLAVYDIFNATEESRTCVIDVIRQNAPDLAFTQERLDERFEAATGNQDRQ